MRQAAVGSEGPYAAFATSQGITVVCASDLQRPALQLPSNLLDSHPVGCMHMQSVPNIGGRQQQLLPHQARQTLLAAATSQGTLLWVLEDAYARAAEGQAAPAPIRLIPQDDAGVPMAAPVTSAAVQINRSAQLAAGGNCIIVVWDLMLLEVVYRLEGHLGVVTCMAFLPHQQHMLVSAAEDRPFKDVQVWDLEASQMLYQSSVLGAAVPTCMAIDPQAQWLAVGCANSTVRLFDLLLLPTCRDKEVLDAAQVLHQVASAVTDVAAIVESKQAAGMLCYNLCSREAERCWLFGEEAGHLQRILNTADLDSLFKTRLVEVSLCCSCSNRQLFKFSNNRDEWDASGRYQT
eukprot:gene12464-12599_t